MRHAAVVATPYVAFSEMFLNPQNLRFVGTRQLTSSNKSQILRIQKHFRKSYVRCGNYSSMSHIAFLEVRNI